MTVEPSTIEPFEISSIRPPTENYSLSFRLTRNCYWNKCAFCPAYKFGNRFSKRGFEEVKEDIRRAGRIDDLLLEKGISERGGAGYHRFMEVAERMISERSTSGEKSQESSSPNKTRDLDPRLEWFLQWFKETPSIEDSLNHVFSWRISGATTCFMGDADALILKPEFLAGIIDYIKERFPGIQRFTVYGRTRTAARLRTLEELRQLRNAGLNRVHFGIESGSDEVLKFVKKGVSAAEHIEGMLKAKEAGLTCTAYVMPGLGGTAMSETHARDTASVLERISPHHIRIRSLQVFPQTPLHNALEKGEFEEASEEQVVREIRAMVEGIKTDTEILSDSASNLLDINGRLPADRGKMLKGIDRYLSLPDRDKLIFSLESRLRSFMGQYGGISSDIGSALEPYLKNSRLDTSSIPEEEMKRITSLIRSKLMP